MSLGFSILQTLKYSDYFGFPLTLEEIHLRLIGVHSSRPILVHTINQMLIKRLIEQSGNYYHLPSHSGLVARRHTRAKLSASLITRARSLASRLARLPGVLAIYLTGSLALDNGDDTSDIDLMIITQRGRLWTTRLLLTLATSLLGLRRTPTSHHNSGKLCLNLYLTPSSYLLPSPRRSLYTAYELIQAIPLYDPHNTNSALLAANPWIHSYLPNFPLPTPTGSDPEGRAQPRQYSVRGGSDPIGRTIESHCYRLQLLYMHGKLTREYITPNSAFFHPHDPGKIILHKLTLLK